MAFNLPEKSLRENDDNVLKRRLLGAAVLIALAVIILPLLLDGSGSESRWRRVEQLRQEPPRILDESAQVVIPDKSQIPRPQPIDSKVPEANADMQESGNQQTQNEVAMTVPENNGDVAAKVAEALGNDSAEAEASGQSASSNEATGERKIVTSSQADASTWVIQVGSFTDQTNALSVRDMLRAETFPAFVSTAQNAGADVFRVKVGPIVNRQRAESLQREIESLLRQTTLIRQYP